MTLWVLVYRINKHICTLCPFYARDHEHAEQIAEKLLEESRCEFIELKEYPYGFIPAHSRIPGRVDDDAME